MSIQRVPIFRLEVNGLDITERISKYVHQITIEDVFDNKFTVSRLSIEVNSKYDGIFFYKDQLKLYLSWSSSPSDILITNIFHLDYIDDNKQNSGQTYTINALEADLTLGFTYGGAIRLTNKTLKQALTDFKEAFTVRNAQNNIIQTVSITENVTSNVYIGTIPIHDNYQAGQVLPNNNNVVKDFDSWNAVLLHICDYYGYFGNLDGRNFKFVRIESSQSFESDFTVPEFDSIFDLSYDSKYTNFYKRYTAFFANTSRVLDLIDRSNSFNIGGKNLELFDEGAYFNQESCSDRLWGKIYADYLSSFNIKIKSVGFPSFKAGKLFYLGDTYGQYSDVYRCTKVVHSVSSNGWIADIEGFPVNKIIDSIADFKSEVLGTVIVIPDFTYSQLISSPLPVTLNATWLDNFARSLNPAYGQTNLGSLFLTEGETEGIRADIAFCQMLIETNNWRETTRISRRNSGGIGDIGGINFTTFSTWQLGIRAHIQHLFAFSVPSSGNGSRPLVNAVVDPRFNFVTRGIAPRVTDITGRWAASPTYGQAILEKLRALYVFLGYKNPTLIP